MVDENENENESSAPAAEAEPSDADLLKILNGGDEPTTRKPATKAKAGESDELDEDEDLDEDGDGSDSGNKKAKAKAAADDESDAEDDDDLENDEGPGKKKAKAASESDDSDDDDDAQDGDDDPDASLDDEDKKVRAKFTPEQQDRFDKAVSKKTRRILELKTELREEQTAREAAEARTTELERSGSTGVTVPTADNPLADIDDETKLDQKLGAARKLRRFALANPDGAFVDTKTGEVVEVDDPENPPANVVAFSKKRIGEILADTEETLQEHGPKHRKFLQDRSAADADAVKTFPWLKNKSSQGTIAVESTLRHAPQLRSVPGIRLLLADAFIGRAVRFSQQQKPGAGNKSDAGRKAPPTPGGSARPPKIDGKRKAAGSSMQMVEKTGDDPGDAALRAILKS